MMSSRNDRRVILKNNHPLYKEKMEEKNLNFIRQVSKLKLNKINQNDLIGMTIIDHVWTTGDKLYKLAHKYYGDVNLWWILAWFNNKPTDGHLKLGDVVHVPTQLEKVLYLYYKQ